jgi:hypothetical protein
MARNERKEKVWNLLGGKQIVLVVFVDLFQDFVVVAEVSSAFRIRFQN